MINRNGRKSISIINQWIMVASLFVGLLITGVPIVEAAPTFTSITPNTASNWGTAQITDLVGTGFEEGTQVILTRDGQPDIQMISMVVSDTNISGEFDLYEKELGAWDVVVVNPDGESTTLIGGFAITQNRRRRQ